MSEGSVIVLVCSTIPHLVDAVRARLTDSAVLVQSISPSLNSEGLLKICNNVRLGFSWYIFGVGKAHGSPNVITQKGAESLFAC
jgi:hypothetical protein